MTTHIKQQLLLCWNIYELSTISEKGIFSVELLELFIMYFWLMLAVHYLCM